MGARGRNGLPWRVVNARVGAELSTGGGQLMRGRAGSEQPRKNLEKCSKAVTKEAHSGGGV